MRNQTVDVTSPFLQTSDVARLAGVSAETVRLWANIGKLRPVVTAGGRRIFDRADVDRFLAARENVVSRD